MFVSVFVLFLDIFQNCQNYAYISFGVKVVGRVEQKQPLLLLINSLLHTVSYWVMYNKFEMKKVEMTKNENINES